MLISIYMFIVPGILVNKIEDLQKQINSVKDRTEWLHLDVMDGKFVENKNLSLSEINKNDLKGFSVETHLMVENPIEYLEDCERLGVKRVIVHYNS